MVPDGGRQNKTASNHKVCKISHKGGGGAFDHQLQQDLDTFAGNCGRGAQIETAQQNRQFGEIQFIEFGSDKQEGEVQNMQNCGNCGADAHNAHIPGFGNGSAVRKKLFREFCQNRQRSHHQNADENKAEVIPHLLQKITHTCHLKKQNTP